MDLCHNRDPINLDSFVIFAGCALFFFGHMMDIHLTRIQFQSAVGESFLTNLWHNWILCKGQSEEQGSRPVCLIHFCKHGNFDWQRSFILHYVVLKTKHSLIHYLGRYILCSRSI